MTDKFTTHLDKALNFPGASKILAEKGVNALNAELQRRGEMAKSKDKPTTAPADADKPANVDKGVQFETSVEELFLVAGEHQKGIDDISAAVKTSTEAADKRISTLETDRDALRQQVADLTTSLKSLLGDSPRRASEAIETKLNESEEKEAKEKINDRVVQYDPMYPGMKVPLKQS